MRGLFFEEINFEGFRFKILGVTGRRGWEYGVDNSIGEVKFYSE